MLSCKYFVTLLLIQGQLRILLYVFIGHKDVWHGSLDIIIGTVACHITTPSYDISDIFNEKNSSECEIRSGELEESREQIVAEAITFSYLVGTGLVPTIAASTKDIKVFAYDPYYDLLYESSEIPLLDSRGNFIDTAVLALWFVLNHSEFCSGVKKSHEELGFEARFKSIVQEQDIFTYEKCLQRGDCNSFKSTASVYKFLSLENSGKFNDI